MICSNVRVLMSEMLDGRLDGVKSEMVSEHMLACTQCRAHWDAIKRVSVVFRSADLAQPPLDFTTRVMQRLGQQACEEEERLASRRPMVAAWGALAVTVALLLAFVAVYGLAPTPVQAGAGPSLNVLSLSMRISGSAIRAATAVEAALDVPLHLIRVIPLPLLSLSLLWMACGTVALALTVARVIAAYQPVPIEAGGAQDR